MVGGAAALSGAWILGPRLGRFRYDEATETWISCPIPGHNAVLAATGTFILWMGFFPFNTAAGFTIVNEGFVAVGRVATVTALAGASGCLTLLSVGYYWREEKTVDLGLSMNGLLSGMVATCSGVGYYNPWAGIPIGITGSLSYYASAWVLERLRIDDPLGAAPVHLGAGAWGMLLVAFFANGEFMENATSDHVGIFFGGNGKLLGWQLAAIALDYAWTMATCSIMFGVLKYFGIFRVSEAAERMGMDYHHHGGAAYIWASTPPHLQPFTSSTGIPTKDVEGGKTSVNVEEPTDDDLAELGDKKQDPEMPPNQDERNDSPSVEQSATQRKSLRSRRQSSVVKSALAQQIPIGIM